MDKVVLRENSAAIPANLTARVQPYIDSGFLDLGVWKGAFSQRRLGEQCADPKLLGSYSWIGFPDLDEFIIMFEKCASAAACRWLLRNLWPLQLLLTR